MRKRYGFIYVDNHDDGSDGLHRTRKDGSYDCQRTIAGNGAEPDQPCSPRAWRRIRC